MGETPFAALTNRVATQLDAAAHQLGRTERGPWGKRRSLRSLTELLRNSTLRPTNPSAPRGGRGGYLPHTNKHSALLGDLGHVGDNGIKMSDHIDS